MIWKPLLNGPYCSVMSLLYDFDWSANSLCLTGSFCQCIFFHYSASTVSLMTYRHHAKRAIASKANKFDLWHSCIERKSVCRIHYTKHPSHLSLQAQSNRFNVKRFLPDGLVNPLEYAADVGIICHRPRCLARKVKMLNGLLLPDACNAPGHDSCTKHGDVFTVSF